MLEASPLELGGGESREIHYTWTPSLPGEALVRLEVEEGKKTSHSLFWKALVSRSNGPAPTVRIVSQQADPTRDGAVGEGMDPTPEPLMTGPQSIIPAVDGVAVEVVKNWLGIPKVVVRWNATPGSTPNTRIQECLLVPKYESGTPVGSILNNPSSMTVKLQDLNQRAQVNDSAHREVLVTGLGEGWHVILISQTTAGGELRAQSQAKVFVPGKPTPWGVVKIPMGVLSILLLILVYRRARRGE